VWTITARLAHQLRSKWLGAGDRGVTTLGDDTRTLAMNVLLGAGFGKHYDFDSTQDLKGNTKDKASHGSAATSETMDYREALRMVLENAILIIGLGPATLAKVSSLHPSLDTVARAVTTFQQYMTDMLAEGRRGGFDSKARGNLLSTLVRASVEEKSLTEKEVYGNMFVYTFGGHDTTALSLPYTFAELALRPDVQAWMTEEIQHVLRRKGGEALGFDDFGKLKRCLAVQVSDYFILICDNDSLINPIDGDCTPLQPGHRRRQGSYPRRASETDPLLRTNHHHSSRNGDRSCHARGPH